MYEEYLRAKAWFGERPKTAFALETGLSGLLCVAYLTAASGQSVAAALPVGVAFGLAFAGMRKLSRRYVSG